MSHAPQHRLTRRALTRGAAWTVPAVVAARELPAMAASQECSVEHLSYFEFTWDPSNSTFEPTETDNPLLVPYASDGYLMFHLGAATDPSGVEPGMTVTMTMDDSWDYAGVDATFGADEFTVYHGDGISYAGDLPVYASTMSSAQNQISFVFDTELSGDLAGGWDIATDTELTDSVTYRLQATVAYTPLQCPEIG